MSYSLPPLSYQYNALEPYIDAKTMEIHYTKHHQTYVDKLNMVLEKYPKLQEKSLEELMKNLSQLAINESDKILLKNHGGGHLNHTLFWSIMAPNKQIDDMAVKEIEKTYTTLENFKKLFSATALNHFGSGWAWLVKNQDGILEIYSLPNQDSPYLKGHTPIFGLDIWEHAYYLKYQNRRAEYIDNWWNVLKLV